MRALEYGGRLPCQDAANACAPCKITALSESPRSLPPVLPQLILRAREANTVGIHFWRELKLSNRPH